MMRLPSVLALVFFMCSAHAANAAPTSAAAKALAAAAADDAGSAVKPKAYDAFVKGATVTAGLVPLVRKDGALYLVIAKDALDRDFIQTAVPSTGLGGYGPAAGEPYVAPARIMRFERHDNRIVLRWPNTITLTKPGTPQEIGATKSLPASVIDVEPIVAENADNGDVVISAKGFLGDVIGFTQAFSDAFKAGHSYRLDPERTYYLTEKAFPQNDVIRVAQTWESGDPDTIDIAPDARSLEIDVTYNIIAAPSDGYMPRIADPRVGYFEQPLLDFDNDDASVNRNVYYLARWNFAPKTPGQPSDATHPLVYTISKDVPLKYRDSVRKALLAWNGPLEKIGIENGISVQDEPTDGTFDEDDLRNNVVRWIDAPTPQYGAEALLITDPRTGEELNAGINVDAVEGLAGRVYRFLIAPARGLPNTDAARDAFVQQAMVATVLHEAGHNMGLQHNFIGSMAYSAQDLQNPAFTQKYGVTSSVMEYAPLNLWPKGTPQGDYEQQVVGPYDYYAIRYGYAYVAGATTPQAEKATLDGWASHWEDPKYRFASDEDVSFGDGHATDPRVAQGDLTDHPLAWCDVQMQMARGLMNNVAARFPARGESWDVARAAFASPLRLYGSCATMAANTIGGEYISRAQIGDPGSATPLSAVPRADEIHAWQQLDRGLFADSAWRFNPDVLNRLTYSEVSTLFGFGQWAYNPSDEHGIAVADVVASYQDRALGQMFAPLTLTRLDSYAFRYPTGRTMSLTDLFDWSRTSIFGNLRDGSIDTVGVVRRNLQVRFANRLAKMWLSPAHGTPADARALARLSLVRLKDDARAGAARPHHTDLGRAHLDQLAAIATQALEARANATP